MSKMEETNGFRKLEAEIIDKDLCTRCGGCVASCPVDALEYGQERIELVNECISCGTCLRTCPGKGVDFSSHENRLFKEARKSPLGSVNGIYRKRMNLIAAEKEVVKAGYFGGRVSALLIHALETGMIEAALLTDWSSSGSLTTGEARIARSRDDILSLASSKYIFSPVLTLLKEASQDESIRSLAVVGLPCHIEAMRNMEEDPTASSIVSKVRYMIGLNCGAPLIDEERWNGLISANFSISPEKVKGFSAFKTSKDTIEMKVKLHDGEDRITRIPIGRYLNYFNRNRNWPRCALCPDYSSDLSDVSVGPPLIRTEGGEKLVEGALKNGLLKKGTFARKVVQHLTDIVAGYGKLSRARREIKKKRSRSTPFPEYR